jgi:hypothetical protein
MPQTFYVTQDEEILSLVGRLRSSALLENVFVVPKRALILQSVVNLRILARESEKIGKSVVIVTQDNDGRMLAEKAGIATRPYSEEALGQDRKSPTIDPDGHVPTKEAAGLGHRVTIGSDDFFGSGMRAPLSATIVPAEPPHPIAPSGEMKLRIRENSPKHLPSLNSMAQVSPVQSNPIPVRPVSPGTSGEVIPRRVLEQSRMRPEQEMTRVQVPQPHPGEGAPGRLSRVFRNRETDRRADSIPSNPLKKTAPPVDGGHVGSRARFWFFLFIAASTLSLLGTAAFLFLPKAEIIVTPNSSSQSVEMEFGGKVVDVVSEKEIPIRLIEKEMDVTVSMETSGDSSGNGEKAKGMITISNDFSSESQPLVATTRFESADGKIFRLVRGVTVPGISETDGKKEPGVIEAEVVADESGESYNIDPSSFTIPGLKGTQKYSKFSAKSKQRMSGGASQSESKNRAVSSGDIVQAKAEAERKFRADFESALGSEISESERILIPSAVVTMIGTASHPQVGVAASSFEYVSKWTGKIFVFSEDDLRAKAISILRERSGVGEGFDVRDISFEYGEATADYEKGLLYIRVRVTTLFVPTIDTESLRNDFLGKESGAIRDALGKYPEIKKIEINLRPKFFSFSVPKNPARVTVRVDEP